MAAGLGFKTFTTGEVLTAADTNGYLMQGILVFASAAARDASITSPQEGQFAFLKDTNVTYYYDGAAWVVSGATGDITAVTAGKGLTGGGASGDVTVSLATTAKGDLVVGTGASTAGVLSVSSDGSTIVADSSTSTGLRYQGSQAAAKNYVINGGMDIWQRGTSFTGAMGATSYNADRWVGWNNPSATISRQASDLTGFRYFLRYQRNSGGTATDGMTLVQNMETANSIPLAGQTVTYSFWARKGANYSATSSLLNAVVYTGTGTDQRYEGYTGGAFAINSTATLTTSWQRFSFTGTISSSATEIAAYVAEGPTGTAGAADYYDITGVQLELGSVATAFTRTGGTIQGELAACQRYYQVLNGSLAGYSIGGEAMANYYRHLVQTRVTPTVTITTNPGYTNSNGLTNDENSITGSRFYVNPIATGRVFATGFVYTLAAEL